MVEKKLKIVRIENKIITERDGVQLFQRIKETTNTEAILIVGCRKMELIEILRNLINIENKISSIKINYKFEKIDEDEDEIEIENFNRILNGEDRTKTMQFADFIRNYANKLYCKEDIPEEIKKNLYKLKTENDIVLMNRYTKDILKNIESKNKR